jgi:Domain of unknown function (DUF1707)
MSELDRYIQGSVACPGVNVTSHPRCGDADRNRAADRVSEAYARGFMTSEEAEARHDAIGQATLGAHLAELTADIPAITRWRGASLPARRESRAELALKWWQQRQPFTGLGGIALGLLLAIAPSVIATALHLGGWIDVTTALTVPEGAVLAIFGLASVVGYLVSLDSL